MSYLSNIPLKLYDHIFIISHINCEGLFEARMVQLQNSHTHFVCPTEIFNTLYLSIPDSQIDLIFVVNSTNNCIVKDCGGYGTFTELKHNIYYIDCRSEIFNTLPIFTGLIRIYIPGVIVLHRIRKSRIFIEFWDSFLHVVFNKS